MSHIAARTIAVAVATVMAFSSSAAASQAAPEITAKPGTLISQETGPSYYQDSATAPPSAPSGVSKRAVVTCNFRHSWDNMHWSKTPSGFGTLSIHAWWTNIDCPSGTKARVEAHLQMLKGKDWVNVGTPGISESSYSGSKTSQRVNARYDCGGGKANQFRSVVDVDLIGLVDAATPGIGPTFTWNCS